MHMHVLCVQLHIFTYLYMHTKRYIDIPILMYMCHLILYFLRIWLMVSQRVSPGICSWPIYSCRPRGSIFFWGWFACVSQETNHQNWREEGASSGVMINNKTSQLLPSGGKLETRTKYWQVCFHRGEVELAQSSVYGTRRLGNCSGEWTRGFCSEMQLISSTLLIFSFSCH